MYLKKWKKRIFRLMMYIIYPKRCIPRLIHYDGYDWCLIESVKPMSSGEVGTEISYVRFNRSDETIYLTEVVDKKRAAAYRTMYEYLWELKGVM